MLTQKVPTKKNARWKRLSVVSAALRSFIAYLDPSHRQTKPRKILDLDQLHPSVASSRTKEVEEVGMGHLLIN